MGALRRQRLAQFREDILAGQRDSDDNLFRILYGLPAEVQIGLARDVTARFLPIFLRNHPGETWATEVASDLEGYYRENEQGLPEPPKNLISGEGHFLGALWALLRAWFYVTRNDLPRVTPTCCTALIWAIGARSDNVWHADDPEAVQAFEDRDYESPLYNRSPNTNVASVAVAKREWLVVADWLEQHDVASHPDTEDAERETWFEWWIDRQCNL